MTNILYIVGLIALVVILFKTISIGIIWYRLIKRPVREGQCTIVDEASIPTELISIFAAGQQELVNLGFNYSHTEVVVEHTPIFCQIYLHPETNTFATVTPSILLGWVKPFKVVFTNLFEGQIVITTDCLANFYPPLPTQYLIVDPYAADLLQQWQKHCQTIAQYQDKVSLATPDAYLIYRDTFSQDAIMYRVGLGWLVSTPTPKVWRYSALGAGKMTWRILSGNPKIIKAIKHQQQAKAPNPSQTGQDQASVTADVEAFERVVQAEQTTTSNSWMVKTLLFVGSVLLFAVTFGLTLSWKTMLILLGVLFIHELGHLAGMMLFGYRDRQILFIPFLGAVTVGKKDNATTLEKVTIYLLGPVPGVILGFISMYLYFTTERAIFYEVGILAIIVNYLNLLPVLPLDGGRVVEALIFIRFPRLKFFFMLFNVGVLLMAGMFIKDKILLFLGISFAISLPAQWRIATAGHAVRQQLPRDASRKDLLKTIFHTFSQPQFKHLMSGDRVALAKLILTDLSGSLPNFKTVMLGLTIYVLALVLPFGVTLLGAVKYVSTHGGTSYLTALMNRRAKPKEPNWAAQLQTATTNEAKWKIYMEAGKWNQGQYDIEKAANYFKLALNMANSFEKKDLRYADTVQALLVTDFNATDQEEYSQKAIERIEQAYDPYNSRIADILELRINFSDEDEDEEEDIEGIEENRENREKVDSLARDRARQDLEQAVVIREKNNQPEKLAEDLARLATIYQRTNQIDKAIDAAKKVLAFYDTNKTVEVTRISGESLFLAELYLTKGDKAQAEQLLQTKITKYKGATSKDSLNVVSLQTCLGWVYADKQDWAAAKTLFQEVLAERQQSQASMLAQPKYNKYLKTANFPLILDICYVQLKQNNLAEAQATFQPIKEALASTEFEKHQVPYVSFLETYQTKANQAKANNWASQRVQAHIETVAQLK